MPETEPNVMETTEPLKTVEAAGEDASALDLSRRGFSRVAVGSAVGIAVLFGMLTFEGIHARSAKKLYWRRRRKRPQSHR
jgi:hypothetical protein